MKITLRLIVTLILVVASTAFFSAYLHVRSERTKHEDEIQRRARLVGESLQELIEPVVEKGPSKNLQRLVEKFGNRERLAGIALFGPGGERVAITPSLAEVQPRRPIVAAEALMKGLEAGAFETIGGRMMHLYAVPMLVGGKPAASLVLYHDVTYIQYQLSQIWRRTFLRILVQMVLISIVTLLIVRWSIVGPIARTAEWMKQLRAGALPETFSLPREDLLTPISREVKTFARHLSAAKNAAVEEARLRQKVESIWTPERLKEHVRVKLNGAPLLAISNREPYMDLRKGRKIETIVPAGGVVTALEPVMHACGGTWIAHGAGDADWDSVDPRGRLRVPQEDPHYTLKRVPLTKEEEDGYYYGFSNEGIWPMCHLAHTRPTFRPEDWESYQRVNKRFAQAALEEIEGVEDPCVLIQDYHFALLPRMIKEKRPDARVALFWHIPWPNPEAFGICPWQKELVYGILGADLAGFHTQFHCNNFLETVDRTLESRIHWEKFMVVKDGHPTIVKPFPISVAFPDSPGGGAAATDRATLFKELGLKAKYLAVGVDRLDYTKGILERLRAVERFLERHPAYQGEFTFVQLGAPTRTHIKRYNDFVAEVEAEADRINWKFKTADWRPIVFLKKHHSQAEIRPFYRHADVCLVTSLSDGMNLVAKEFVAAREDNGGVLILSRFAGASQELRDALIVNPYDVDQTADAIQAALEMKPKERESRMRRMREGVRENNIYRWAGNLIEDLARIRLEPVPVEPLV